MPCWRRFPSFPVVRFTIPYRMRRLEYQPPLDVLAWGLSWKPPAVAVLSLCPRTRMGAEGPMERALLEIEERRTTAMDEIDE